MFGEYTRTKYKTIKGKQWKITETKVSLFVSPSPGKLKNPYRIARVYSRKVDGQWQFVTCGRTVNTR